MAVRRTIIAGVWAAFSKDPSATILRTGSTFNQTLDFDPVLVSPECSATMVNGGEPGAIFHANPVADYFCYPPPSILWALKRLCLRSGPRHPEGIQVTARWAGVGHRASLRKRREDLGGLRGAERPQRLLVLVPDQDGRWLGRAGLGDSAAWERRA